MEEVLQRTGVDVVALVDEHVLGPADQEEPAVLVEAPDVAGAQPAVPVLLGGQFGVALVAVGDLRAADPDLTGLALRHLGAFAELADDDFGVEQRRSDTPDRCGRLAGEGAEGHAESALGEAVPLGHPGVGEDLPEAAKSGRVVGGGTGDDGADGRVPGTGGFRDAEQCVKEGGGAQQIVHPVPVDVFEVALRGEAARDHQSSAGQRGDMLVVKAHRVVHGRHRDGRALAQREDVRVPGVLLGLHIQSAPVVQAGQGAGAPAGDLDDVVDHVAVQHTDGLGATGGASGEGQVSQVVAGAWGTRLGGRGEQLLHTYGGSAQLLGQRVVRCRGLRRGRDDDDQFQVAGGLGEQARGGGVGDRPRSARAVELLAHGRRRQCGVDRGDHAAGEDDGVVADGVPGGVGQEQCHRVARADAVLPEAL